ncbi:E1 ubiquitin-activating protein aos1 [Entomophthora muscae]|uniref:E1 ubiquitin-activating protein aos1 n=1 Tax=Entomophthora muscae TaxID=34485 RepID=A0ACC2SI15_9FUNG|nr:E1 ubiquitin-activating protein aos1 [Entomophthora muscae]
MSLQISKDETAIYDRQIRVWGFEAQARMKNSSILVLGTSGLSIELMKNMVLAGVGQIIVVDERSVELGELGSNFYINFSDQGKMRAEVCVEKLKLLNPKVSMLAKTSFTPELLEGQHLVCHADATLDEMVKILVKVINFQLENESNLSFQRHQIYFRKYIWHVGISFFDLVAHKCKVAETIDETCYVSLSQSFKTTFAKGTKKQLLRKLSPTFILNKVILDFCNAEKCRPSQSPEDLAMLKNMLEKVVLDFFPVNEKLQKEVLASFNSAIPFYNIIPLAQGELAPCTAIIGGIMAQEALKIVSAKDKPINNIFVYNGLDGEGLVHQLAPEE